MKDIDTKRVTASTVVTTLRELIDTIEQMAQQTGLTGNHVSEQIYVTINSDSVRLRLVEETLTDGSIVHNIEMTEAAPRGWK